MTIRKGENWGELRLPAATMTIVSSDQALRAIALDMARPDAVGLIGGDMMRTLGGTADPERFVGDTPIPHVPVDVVRVVADGDRTSVFVAHLVARRSWWRGQVILAMNAQFLGRWDVAPRSHPNDGKVDIISVAGDLSMRQRWMARSRLPLGTHLPHPSIAAVQRDTTLIEFDRATPIWLDGERWGSARRVELTVQPGVLTVAV